MQFYIMLASDNIYYFISFSFHWIWLCTTIFNIIVSCTANRNIGNLISWSFAQLNFGVVLSSPHKFAHPRKVQPYTECRIHKPLSESDSDIWWVGTFRTRHDRPYFKHLFINPVSWIGKCQSSSTLCQPKGGPSFCLPRDYHQACDGTCREEIKYITNRVASK